MKSKKAYFANLAAAVVFPVPCKPASRMTVGLPSSLRANGACFDPITSTNSSFITFTNCCSGVTPGHERSIIVHTDSQAHELQLDTCEIMLILRAVRNMFYG